MFIPPGAITLEKVEFPQLRVGLQGEPGTGKTEFMMSFPNPVVVDFDKGLTRYAGRKDVMYIPFWNRIWIEEYSKQNKLTITPGRQANRKDILKHWLENNASKFTPDQTLGMDSWTSIQEAFDIQTGYDPVYTKTGQIDEYAFWDEKIEWSEQIMQITKELQCHVVVTFHEARERDKKTGEILSKVQPLMQGKFVTKIMSYFSDFYRTLVFDKLDKEKKPIFTQVENGLKKEVEYFVQTQSDGQANCKCRIDGLPLYLNVTNKSGFELLRTLILKGQSK